MPTSSLWMPPRWARSLCNSFHLDEPAWLVGCALWRYLLLRPMFCGEKFGSAMNGLPAAKHGTFCISGKPFWNTVCCLLRSCVPFARLDNCLPALRKDANHFLRSAFNFSWGSLTRVLMSVDLCCYPTEAQTWRHVAFVFEHVYCN